MISVYTYGVMDKNPIELLLDLLQSRLDTAAWRVDNDLWQAVEAAKAFTPAVVISIEGGNYTGGGSNCRMEVIIRDWDNINAERDGGDNCYALVNGECLYGTFKECLDNPDDGCIVTLEDGREVEQTWDEFKNAQDPLEGKTCEEAGYQHIF
jgi:hypothetical protein